MRDLDEKIAAWRTRMAAGGIKTPAVLDELEAHLREDVERQMRTGHDEGEAFEAAVQHIGRSDLLKAEFAKIGEAKELPIGRVAGAACCVAAALYSMMLAPNLFITIPELVPWQRNLGLMAVVLTVFFLASLRFSYKFLPVIRSHRARTTTARLCGVAGVVWLFIIVDALPNVTVPRLVTVWATADQEMARIRNNNSPGFGEPLVVHNTISPFRHYRRAQFSLITSRHYELTGPGLSLFWATTLAALLGAAAYGLEEAARRRPIENSYV
jgi:hypothetical protein